MASPPGFGAIPNGGFTMPWDQFVQGAGDLLFGSKAQAPEQRSVDFGQSNEDRANQMRLLASLQAMAAGNGPSLAQGQLQMATDQNINQAMALGAAQQGQGLGYASALRGIADQSAAARQQAAAQSALIRNQEQMQAMQGQASLLGGMRGQDLGQTGMQQQGNQFYDALKAQASQANANHGVVPALLQAGGSLLGMGLGRGGGTQSSGLVADSGYGPTQYGSNPVMSDGSGFRGSAPQPGDWTAGNVAHASRGGQVPGYARGGDAFRNDTVPAMLSPGEIVIPRSITMAPNAGELSRMFVEMVQQHRAKLPASEEHPALRSMRKAA